MSPARNLTTRMIRKDKKVKGWMRVTGPHPCAFCSMLASRGFDFVKEVTAKIHPNCMCQLVPIFLNTPAYSARDRFFMDNWGEVTKHVDSYSGTVNGKRKYYGKLNAWRRWLAKQYSAHKVPDQDVYGPARPS